MNNSRDKLDLLIEELVPTAYEIKAVRAERTKPIRTEEVREIRERIRRSLSDRPLASAGGRHA